MCNPYSTSRTASSDPVSDDDEDDDATDDESKRRERGDWMNHGEARPPVRKRE